jgi:murein DD-endopeptidase MepM/ murein hydrolase activator NlpD
MGKSATTRLGLAALGAVALLALPAAPAGASRDRPAPAIRAAGLETDPGGERAESARAAGPAASGARAAGKRKRRVVLFGQRALKRGMRGKDVRVLQKYLTKLGFATSTDGAFGKTTFRRVKSLERARGWRVDGKVSKKDARRIRALLTRPAGLFYAYGPSSPAVNLTAQRAGTATVEVVDADGVAVAALSVSFPGGGEQTAIWSGVASNGAYAPDATYSFRLGAANSAGAAITGGQVQPFLFRQRAFPVPGTHSFGGAGSRFGAPRGGRLHQGQDIAAACGERVLAAEGGLVRVDAYQANGAGHYVVVDGGMSGTDYVYMHLRGPSPAAPGQIVRTGQEIGRVGNTGSSSGCHLHFEHWTAPGWYVGGYPYDPLPELQYWDSYS